MSGPQKKRRSPKRRPSALPMATQDQGLAGQIGGAWGGHLSDKPPTRLADSRSWPFEDFLKNIRRSGRAPERTTPAKPPAWITYGNDGAIAGIAESVWCAGRRARGDRSNTARRGIPRPSAYSGCKLLRATTGRHARPQRLRPCDGSPSAWYRAPGGPKS